MLSVVPEHAVASRDHVVDAGIEDLPLSNGKEILLAVIQVSTLAGGV